MQDLYNIDEIRESGLFLSKSEMSEYVLLGLLYQSKTPLGSWNLQEKLGAYGVQTSLATIGRNLKHLDSLGYTDLVSGHGRMITQTGIAYYQEKTEELRRSMLNNRLIDSVKIDSIKQMMNLFNARILIEKEIVRLATTLGTQSDFDHLLSIIKEADANQQDRELVTKLNRQFHIDIANITSNPFLITMVDILMNEQWGLEAENTEVVEGYQNCI